MNHRLGIDVDGVLAEFDSAYSRLFVAVTGKDLFRQPPQEWDYELAAGYTKEERKQVWAQIDKSFDFWLNLGAYPEAVLFLDALKKIERDLADVYFITTRSGTAKQQTERWLQKHGFARPTVLVNKGNKGDIARALDLTAVLDDKPENLRDIKAAHPSCRVILMRHTWNTHAWNDYEGIDHLLDFFDKAL